MPVKIAKLVSTQFVWLLLVTAAEAADPGLAIPASSALSDQKAGSILVYNFYISNPARQDRENTRISITNTNSTAGLPGTAFVHLFFLDGESCMPADAFLCLTPNQTASFLASEVDPGTKGYLIAVAVDPATGCPVSFNFLIGDAYLKLASGHVANLAAEAFAALYTGALPGCNPTDLSATLSFDDAVYNRAPRVLAASSLLSQLDGNSTFLIVNAIGGNLVTTAASIGSLFGYLFDDEENAFSFTINGVGCQLLRNLATAPPRTAPPFNRVIPANHTGWMKLFVPPPNNNGLAILGAVVNANSLPSGITNCGRNLHHLTLAPSATLIIPVMPPAC